MRIVLLAVVVCLAGAAGVGWLAATEGGEVEDPIAGPTRANTPAVPWHHVETQLQPSTRLRRADLPFAHAMPDHGVYVATMGMGSLDAFTVDFDLGTITRDYTGLYGNEPRGSIVKPLTVSDLADIRRVAHATWNDPPYKPTHGAMDIDQIVAITDGDDAFYRTDSLLEGTTGTAALLALVEGVGTATFGTLPR